MRILDSDHAIGIIRGTIDPHHYIAIYEKMFITAISVGELLYGAYRSHHTERNLSLVNDLLARCTILNYDEQTARIFSKLKVQLEKLGTRLDDADLHIASITLHYNAILVTHNQRHFQRIPHLQIEDWIG